MDMLYDGCILGDSSIDVLLCRTIDIVVTLHTDTINGYTGILHLLHHVIDAVTLAGVTLVVVVIEQQGVGVSLAGKFKSLGDELITTEFEVAALAIGAARGKLTVSKRRTGIVLDGLVHYVPAIDDILITVYHGMDMLTQTLIEHLFLYFLTLLVGKHPVGEL